MLLALILNWTIMWMLIAIVILLTRGRIMGHIPHTDFWDRFVVSAVFGGIFFGVVGWLIVFCFLMMIGNRLTKLQPLELIEEHELLGAKLCARIR